MWTLEKINNELIKNPDNSIDNTSKRIEEWNLYTSVNIERTSDFCKENFSKLENSSEICKTINNDFIAWLNDYWFDIDDWSKEKWIKLEVA